MDDARPPKGDEWHTDGVLLCIFKNAVGPYDRERRIMDLGCKVSTFAFVRPKLSRTIIFVFPLLPSMLGLGSYAKCARTHATQKSYVTFVHASIKCGMLGVRWYFFLFFMFAHSNGCEPMYLRLWGPYNIYYYNNVCIVRPQIEIQYISPLYMRYV